MDYLSVSRNEQLSFLRARDPSILSCNFASKRENVRTNLMPDIQENEQEEDDKNIEIHLRIKYADMDTSYKIESNEIQCSIPTSSHSNNLKDVESIVKKFTFSHIFPPEATQEEIFNLAVKPKLFKFINGENATLMSYGASGSGKTFTIVGTITDPGIIPRTLEYLFRTLPELPELPLVKPTQSMQVEILSAAHCKEEIFAKNNLLSMAKMTIAEGHTNTYQEMQSRLSTEPAGILDEFSDVSLAVWVSFCEIYNENIHDLLIPTQKQKGNNRAKLKLASCNENTYIKDLTNICVSSGIEAYQILQYGLHNLKYASTSINPHSSRSHCIFTIKIAQVVNGTNVYRLNYFNFCDLAGSERLKKTMNEGDRLRESNNINASLLVLGRCINYIRDNQKKNIKKIVPYRDSKLTRLFQRALSGSESISMIVNINPTANMFEESLHTLNFSAVAKEVVVKRTPIKIKKKTRFSSYLQAKNLFAANQEADACEINRMQDLIDKLYLELERQTQYCAEQEIRIRDEIWEQQNIVIEQIKENNRQHVAAINERYKRYIQGLKDLYENKANKSEVIDLVSSSDEDEDGNHKQQSLREEINSLRVKLTNAENENILLKNRIQDTEKNYIQAQQQIESYKEQIITLKQTFTSQIRDLDLQRIEAENTYEATLHAYEEHASILASENYRLEEENSDLNTQIETYTKLMDLQKDDLLP